MPQKRAVSQDRLTEEQLRTIEKYDPSERVRAYLRDSHAAENAANAYEYASQRSKRNDDTNEKGGGTSKEATVDVTSVSDELNGKHAKKQRLAERQEQKRRRAAVCKPQLPDSSAGSGDDGDDTLPRRSKRSHGTKKKKLTEQDRSRSKAAQIKEKGRRQKDDGKGKKSKSRGFMEILTSLKALQPRPTRMTIPQLPRQGIFSVGTSSPHEVAKVAKKDEKEDRHRGKRVRRASRTPCRCDHHDESMSTSTSASSTNDGKTERIKALESTVERLTRMMALQEKKETQESATSTSSEASWSNTVREGTHTANRLAGLQKNNTEVANRKAPYAVLDVSSMAWAEQRNADRAPTVKEEADRYDEQGMMLQQEKHVPSLAFRNGRPDQHPTNGWRSQHRVDEIGVDELQRRFFAVGGPRFRVSSPVQEHEEAQPSALELSFDETYAPHHPHFEGDDMPQHSNGQRSHHTISFQEKDMDEYAASAHCYDADEMYYEHDDATWTRDRMPEAHGFADEDHFTSSPTFERQHEEQDTYLVDGLPSFCTISRKDLPSMWQPARRY